MFRNTCLVAALVAASSVLGSCSNSNKSSNSNQLPRFTVGPNAMEPAAGAWHTWVLREGRELRPPAPPGETTTIGELEELRRLAAQRTPAVRQVIDTWNQGSIKLWGQMFREFAFRETWNGPRMARAISLFTIAMHDATVAAFDAKYFHLRARPSAWPNPPEVYGVQPESPSYVSERAAVAAAAAGILRSLFPNRATLIDASQQTAQSSVLWAGVHFPSDVEEGRKLGERVAAAVLQYAANDGSNAVYSGIRLRGPGFWEPTPPDFVTDPLEAACGQWQAHVLARNDQFRPAPPPPFGSEAFRLDVEEVWRTWQTLTPTQRAFAEFFDGRFGVEAPPLFWHRLATEILGGGTLNEARAARALAMVAIAQYDAYVASYEAKYFFWRVRPVTEVRRVYDSNWLPPIPTPASPSFPCDHSAGAAAMAEVLVTVFPAYTPVLQRFALDCSDSRIFGGVHFRSDLNAGLALGSEVGQLTVELTNPDR